jgi:hypothetical protein
VAGAWPPSAATAGHPADGARRTTALRYEPDGDR